VWGIWNLGFKEVLVRWVTCTQNFSHYGSALAINFPVSPFFLHGFGELREGIPILLRYFNLKIRLGLFSYHVSFFLYQISLGLTWKMLDITGTFQRYAFSTGNTCIFNVLRVLRHIGS
jgi:hypothetical protein